MPPESLKTSQTTSPTFNIPRQPLFFFCFTSFLPLEVTSSVFFLCIPTLPLQMVGKNRLVTSLFWKMYFEPSNHTPLCHLLKHFLEVFEHFIQNEMLLLKLFLSLYLTQVVIYSGSHLVYYFSFSFFSTIPTIGARIFSLQVHTLVLKRKPSKEGRWIP